MCRAASGRPPLILSLARLCPRPAAGYDLLVIRWPVLLSVLLLLTLAPPAFSDAAGAEGTIISGGDLPHPVRLTAIDEDAFFRRLGPPPKLDETPEVIGTGYRISTRYWDDVLRNSRDDRAAAEMEATYYEDGGYVRARQGDEDVWLVLDLRQRAVIDRYLRLTRAGLLRDRPGILEVLLAASRGETIGIDIGGNQLSSTEARELWTGLLVSPRPSFREQPQRPLGENGAWLVFSLEEGRAVQVFYDQSAGTLTDFFGSETYQVIPPVAFTIETVTRGGGSVLTIEQQPGRGSAAWWIIMAGGGIACIAAAIWLRRQFGAAGTSSR